LKKAIRFLSLTIFLAGAAMVGLSSLAQADTCWSGTGISCGYDGVCCSATSTRCTTYKCPPKI
jgi:hypothetical protein